ncbi:MAG: M20/M25/M40 family metallo-hydrolase, partial [Verrucomicrobiae bacterium]|nr:M20/M25/M40 family metallo-hydrolase [Verrucomicrobiae bacterium]
MIACANWVASECRRIGLHTTVHETKGHPIVVATTNPNRTDYKPHFLVYGHYDVQPPDPLHLWRTPPFEPRIEGNSLFGRGASHNTGQPFAPLKAVEALLQP